MLFLPGRFVKQSQATAHGIWPERKKTAATLLMLVDGVCLNLGGDENHPRNGFARKWLDHREDWSALERKGTL
jgi:hypothetical protein